MSPWRNYPQRRGENKTGSVFRGFFQGGKSLRDPFEIRVSHMTPIVERDLAHAAFSERADRCKKFAFRFEIGKGRAQDPAQTPLAAQPALHVEEIGFDPPGSGFVEADLFDV